MKNIDSKEGFFKIINRELEDRFAKGNNIVSFGDNVKTKM